MALPDELCHCATLEELHADTNQITELPAAIGKLRSLSVLSLRSNSLRTVPASLSRCTVSRYHS